MSKKCSKEPKDALADLSKPVKRKFAKYFNNPTKTVQYFADECDIGNILKKYAASGVLDHVKRSEPSYMDVSGLKTYAESLQVVLDAQDAFMALPAKERVACDNDPQKWIEMQLKEQMECKDENSNSFATQQAPNPEDLQSPEDEKASLDEPNA